MLNATGDIFQALEAVAARSPGAIALSSRRGHLTYRRFVGNIASAALAATRSGIRPGQLVVVGVLNPDVALVLCLALMRIGCRVGYHGSPTLYDTKGVAVDAVIVEPSAPPTQHPTIIVNDDWFTGVKAPGLPPPASAYSLIYSSSGSTGRPKLIEAARPALTSWNAARQAHAYLDSGPRFLSTMGSRRMGALNDTIRVLTSGGVVIRAVDYRATTILETIREFRPEYLLTTPHMLNALLRLLDESPGTTPRVRWLRISGAYCSPALRRAALDRLADEYIFSYGAAETQRIAWGYSKDVSADRAVGRVVDGVDVAAFDDSGNRLPPGSEGLIRVKPPVGALAAYIGSDAKQQASISNGWFTTGDIGTVDAERTLFIRGRANNVINTGGGKVSPEALEEQIITLSGVVDVGVAGIDLPEGYQEVCAAIVSSRQPTVAEINAYLRRNKVWQSVEAMKVVPAIPRTETGKIDRVALKQLCAKDAAGEAVGEPGATADPAVPAPGGSPKAADFPGEVPKIDSVGDIFRALKAQAARSPGAIALASPRGQMAYGRFVASIASAALAATRSGLRPGQLVVVAVADPDMALILALALMRVGCRVGYSANLEFYDRNGVAVDAVLAEPSAPPTNHPTIIVNDDWYTVSATGLAMPPPANSSSIIFASSGSTGRPKLIEYDSKALSYRVSNRLTDPDLGDAPRFLSAMGSRTAAHLINALATILKGGTLIGSNDRSGRSVLDAIRRLRPHYVIVTPATLIEMLRRLDKRPMAIDKVRILRTAGSPCAPELQRAALDRLAEEFISYYGSTETGGIASGYHRDVVAIEGCVGRVVDGIEAAAFDSNNARLQPGEEGEIRVKLPEGSSGRYIGENAAEQSAFKDGWFATGDIGLVDANRNLIIRGRATNVINTGGNKISPEALEGRIMTLSDVVDVGVAGIDLPEGYEEVCAAIVSSRQPKVEDINAHLRRGKVWGSVQAVKMVPAIPRTETGKIDRVALKRLCAEDAAGVAVGQPAEALPSVTADPDRPAADGSEERADFSGEMRRIVSVGDIFQALEAQAARSPGAIALAWPQGHMNYADFVGNVASAALAATRSGLGPGHLVVVAASNPDMALVLTLALMRIGCRVGYSANLELYDRNGVAVDAVIADAWATPTSHRTIVPNREWLKGAAGTELAMPPPANSFSIIFSSSGSTGRPKLVENAHTTRFRHLRWRQQLFFPCPQARVLSAFGGRTSPNLNDALAVLTDGGTIVRSSDRSSVAILDTIQLFRPDYMTLAPVSLHAVLRQLETNPAILRKVRAIRLTGAYCSPQLQTAALDRICEQVILTYGTNETGGLAWKRSDDIQEVERSVGRLFDDVEVAAFDSNGRQLPVGSEGQIRARVPAEGVGRYIGRDAGEQTMMNDGWFATGDIGLVDEHRNLVIRGRATNVINTGGNKISPEVIEEGIMTFYGVADVGVAGIDVPEGFQKICAVIVSSGQPTVADINAHLLRCKVRAAVQAVKVVPAIPKTEAGKIDRVALKRLCGDADAEPAEAAPAAAAEAVGSAPVGQRETPDFPSEMRKITSIEAVFEALRACAERIPGAIALASRQGYMNHADFVGNVASAQAAAVRRGIRPGQLVVVAVTNADFALIVALALMRIGCRVGYVRDLELYESAGVPIDVVIAEPSAPPMRHPTIVADREWFRGATALGLVPPADPPDPSLVVASSGSTGTQKLLEIPAGGILQAVSRRTAIVSRFPRPRVLPSFGGRTQTNFADSLAALVNGGTVLRTPDLRSEGILDAVHLYSPDYVIIAPSTLHEMLRALEAKPRRMRKIPLLRTGGAYCAPQLQQAALDRIADDLLSVYGSNETGWIAMGLSRDIQAIDGAVGKMFDDFEAAAFDSDGQMLGVGCEGEIRVKPPAHVVATYLGGDAERRTPLQDGWFRTGDIGVIDADGNLLIHGRANSVINFGGNKVNPEYLEGLISTFDRVVDVGVTGVQAREGFERICAAVVSLSPPTLDDINAHLLRRNSRLSVEALKIVPAVPRTETGKIDRVALRRLCSEQQVRVHQPTGRRPAPEKSEPATSHVAAIPGDRQSRPPSDAIDEVTALNSVADVFDVLDAWAERSPGALALVSRGGHMSYADFVGSIASAVASATRAGVKAGHLVVVGVGNPHTALVLALALMRIGCRVGYVRDLALYESSGVVIDAVLTDRPATRSRHPTIDVDQAWLAGAKARSLSIPPPASSFSVIVASSGSTGLQKLIERTHTIIFRDVRIRTLHLFPCRQPTVLPLFGGRTSANLHDALAALTDGGTFVTTDDRSATGMIDSIQLFRPDYVAAAPSLLYEVLQQLKAKPAPLPKVQTIRAAGAYCSPQLQKDVLDFMADDIVVTYGATEFGFLAWGHSREIQGIERSVGKLFDDVDVAAFDGNGQRLPVGSEGEIRARVPQEGAGTYIGSESGKPSAFENGWFRTGDIGVIDADGNLLIHGRANSVINFGGNKVNPEYLEGLISTFDRVVDVGVTGVQAREGFERICAAVVSLSPPTLDDINAHLLRRNSRLSVEALKIVPAVPRTETGKIDRVALRRLCAE